MCCVDSVVSHLFCRGCECNCECECECGCECECFELLCLDCLRENGPSRGYPARRPEKNIFAAFIPALEVRFVCVLGDGLVKKSIR